MTPVICCLLSANSGHSNSIEYLYPGSPIKLVGVIFVTCRKAHENEAVLANPSSDDTCAIAFPLESLSIACTIRARCLQTLNVKPVSEWNNLLIVRTDVAAREAT